MNYDSSHDTFILVPHGFPLNKGSSFGMQLKEIDSELGFEWESLSSTPDEFQKSKAIEAQQFFHEIGFKLSLRRCASCSVN